MAIPDRCWCVGVEAPAALMTTHGTMMASPAPMVLRSDSAAVCDRHGFPGLRATAVANAAHIASGAAVCFARGLNDAPKIVAPVLVASAFDGRLAILAIGLSMLAGGLLSRRVARTVSFEIAALDGTRGLVANLTTATLVCGASVLGLPVSTTHVACGTLIGAGAVGRRVRWRMIGPIVLAWGVTLPIAALLGGAILVLLGGG